jgi:polyisoprenoid-binding protein YceI
MAGLCLLLNKPLQEQAYNHDNSKQLQWTGKAAFNAYSLSGSIRIKTVSSEITANTIENLRIVIDMTSLDHENSDLKKHLRSKDFFQVDKFKTASFQLLEPAVISQGKVTLKGLLSIKGISKEESFIVAIEDNTLLLDIRINRINYGITFNSPSIFEKMKDQAIADEFQLKGNIQLN